MKQELFHYQQDALVWLREVSWPRYIAHEPGLGKTITAIAHADGNRRARNILVLCPAVARLNWAREFKKWQAVPRDTHVILSHKDHFDVKDPSVVICSYDMIGASASSIKRRVFAEKWDLLILDEAHMLGRRSQRTTAVLHATKGLYTKAANVLPLSGTPATKSVSELYPIMSALWPNLLKGMSWEEWENTYCRLREFRMGQRKVRNVMGTRPEKLGEIKKMLSPIMQVLKTDDVLKDIPPLRCDIFPVQPQTSSAEAQDLQDAQARLDAMLDAADNPGNDLETNQTAFATERRIIGLSKVSQVLDLVRSELEADSNKKVVVFAWHREVIENLRDNLDSFGAVCIDGRTNATDKQDAQDRFQQDKNIRVFVGQIKAAGTNLTLTAAHDVILAEASWTPGDNYQAIRRCRRIGQTKPVLARYVALEGADDRIMRVLAERASELDELFASKGGEQNGDQ